MFCFKRLGKIKLTFTKLNYLCYRLLNWWPPRWATDRQTGRYFKTYWSFIEAFMGSPSRNLIDAPLFLIQLLGRKIADNLEFKNYVVHPHIHFLQRGATLTYKPITTSLSLTNKTLNCTITQVCSMIFQDWNCPYTLIIILKTVWNWFFRSSM